MAHVQANIAQFHSKLVEFWSTGKYTDVTIECDDNTLFKCHRVALATACKYFDTMFSSNFQERSADHIRLCEISAVTFGLVLQFIYTGDVSISVDNVSSLLQASELFELTAIEDLCVQFVEKNGLTVPNSWDVFVFARATNKKALVDILSHRIATRFEIFSKDNRFLKVSFSDLSFILERMSLSSMKRKDISVLAAVARWVEHKGEESQCRLDELIELIGFENIPQMYFKPIFAKLLANSAQSPKRFKRCSNVSELGLLQESLIPSPSERLLHIFVEEKENRLMKLYSMNNSRICSVSATFSLNHPYHRVSAVVVDDSYFYCLNYVPDATSDHQTFYAHTSVNMDTQIKLKSPPVIFPSILASAQQNNIYFYHPSIVSSPAIRSNVSRLLSDEEIKHGIYAYNCEVDDWFAVPMMKIKVQGSSLATCNDKLYLIGGCTDGIIPSTIFQGYDSRVGSWEELPRTNYKHVDAASCFMAGKIYVLGRHLVERYDLAAGRWENLAPWYNTSSLGMAVPSHHLKQVWSKSSAMRLIMYNVELNERNTVPIITEENDDLRGQIIEAFVFKSL